MNRLLALENEVLRRSKKATARAAAQSLRRVVRPFQTATAVWPDASVQSMKTFLVNNATGGNPQNCIDTINEALKILFAPKRIPTGSAVHLTMDALATAGLATSRTDFEFLDAKGKTTTGVVRPDHLGVVLLDELVTLANNAVGWSVFGFSLMDGYHSVLLSLDNSTSTPRVYWSDQWPTKGGFKEYDKAGLNAEVTRLTQGWWDGQPANKKHRTRCTVWRTLP